MRAVYANACSEYEARELHFHEAMERQLADCDADVDKFENELEYLKTENRDAAVKRESTTIKHLEKDLVEKERTLEAEQARLVEYEAAVDQLKDELATKKSVVEEAEAEHAAIRKMGHDIE